MNIVQLKNDLLEVDTMYSSRVIRNCSQFWSAYIAIKSERKFIDYFNEWRLKKGNRVQNRETISGPIIIYAKSDK